MYSLLKGNKLFLYFFEVPLSNILTIEKRQKQMAPKPTNTRAGTKKALSRIPSSKRKAPINKHKSAVITGIKGIRFAKAYPCLQTLANYNTLLEILKQTNPKPIIINPVVFATFPIIVKITTNPQRIQTVPKKKTNFGQKLRSFSP